MGKKWFLLIVVLVLLGIDLGTKQLVMNFVERGAVIPVIPNFLWITYQINTGIAWSLLKGSRWFISGIALIAALVMTYYLFKAKRLLVEIGLILMLAGTLGNFIDRVVYGFVRDMIATNIFGYHFPVFNLADMCLVLGVGLLALDIFISERSERHETGKR